MESTGTEFFAVLLTLRTAVASPAVTEEAGGKMDKLGTIVDNIEKISEDVKSSTDMINRTVSPALGNIQAISAGMKKAVETWNEFGGGVVDKNVGEAGDKD